LIEYRAHFTEHRALLIECSALYLLVGVGTLLQPRMPVIITVNKLEKPIAVISNIAHVV